MGPRNMKKLLLAGVAASSVLTASAAHAQPADEVEQPPAQVTVAPPTRGLLQSVGSMPHIRCVETHRVVLSGL
jgi:hypothetical protein